MTNLVIVYAIRVFELGFNEFESDCALQSLGVLKYEILGIG